MLINKEKLIKELLNNTLNRCIRQIVDDCEVKVSPAPGPLLKHWQPKPGDWTIISNGMVMMCHSKSEYTNAGSERDSKKAAKLASNRMTRANRLSALAHELGGEREFVHGESNYYVLYVHKSNTWENNSTTLTKCPSRVYMTKDCAVKICTMLNIGEVTL